MARRAGRKRKLQNPLILTMIIEGDQHERLRELSFKKRIPMAELIREALSNYLLIKVETVNLRKVKVGGGKPVKS